MRRGCASLPTTPSRARRGAGARDASVAVAVDVVPLALGDDGLFAASVRVGTGGDGLFAFPGGRVQARESLDDAAHRYLARHGFDLDGAHVEQLYAFGEPGRDPESRVVSVAYLALLPRREASADVHWHLWDRLPSFAYDHGAVAEKARDRLRGKLSYTNVAFGLLEDGFTLAELQRVYETILGRDLDRRNFRKKILGMGLVEPLGRVRRGPHRPAELFRFAERRLVRVDDLPARRT